MSMLRKLAFWKRGAPMKLHRAKALIDRTCGEWPDDLLIGVVPGTDRVLSLYHKPANAHGIAVFTSRAAIQEFSRKVLVDPSVTEVAVMSITFDQAREIAKHKGPPVRAVMLADDPFEPLIHYVR